jgi:hypothetical protein
VALTCKTNHCNRVIVMELASHDLQGFTDWYISGITVRVSKG